MSQVLSSGELQTRIITTGDLKQDNKTLNWGQEICLSSVMFTGLVEFQVACFQPNFPSFTLFFRNAANLLLRLVLSRPAEATAFKPLETWPTHSSLITSTCQFM